MISNPKPMNRSVILAMISPVIFPVVLAVLALAVLSGCSQSLETVEPWERDKLAGDLMRPDLNPMQDRNWDHIYFSKEGGIGAFGGGGGGCGCN